MKIKIKTLEEIRNNPEVKSCSTFPNEFYGKNHTYMNSEMVRRCGKVIDCRPISYDVDRGFDSAYKWRCMHWVWDDWMADEVKDE